VRGIARLLVAVVLTAALAAAASAETARQILDRRRQLDDTTRHWDDREQHMTLTIERKDSAAQRRELSMYERHLAGHEEEAILFFEVPASIKGVGLLALSHPGQADEQWFYLPALKRVRNIAATTSDRSESFVGTDLTFHDLDVLQDMTSWSESEAATTLLGDEVIGGVPTYHIELRPTRSDVYYPRIQLWLGKDDLVTRRTELFKDGGEAVKRVDQSDIRTVDGIPLAHRIEAATVGRGSRTVMEVTKVRFNQKLEDDLFTQRALVRGKR
jgi:outer membrane lipoprotein-sorting protein